MCGLHTDDTTVTLESYLRRTHHNGITVPYLLNRLVYLHTRPGRYVFDETLRLVIIRSIQGFRDT